MRTLLPEWSEQSGVMLTWPHTQSDWADVLEDVEPVFVEIAKVIADFEPVLICVYNESHKEHVKTLLESVGADANNLRLFVAPSNDTWARDHGPITILENNAPHLLDFVFNGWGNKFAAELDTQINQCLHQQGAFADTSMTSLDFVLEGGSIETDGHDTLLTTTQCLLSKERNPTYSKTEIEALLTEQFGLDRILWLENGHLEGDDTDAHIDTLARFVSPTRIVYVACDDPNDSHYAGLKTMEEELKRFVDYQGNPYKLFPLPWPKAAFDEDGRRLPATYANFLIINGAVLLPTYGDEINDNKAKDALRKACPNHKIIGIDCRKIIEQNGSLHCLTMQLPKGVLAS